MKSNIKSNRNTMLWVFIFFILVISIYILTYFMKKLTKITSFRDRIIIEKYEGSVSKNLGFLTLLTTEMKIQLNLKSYEEIQKTLKIRKYLLNLKEKIENIKAIQTIFNINADFNLEKIQNISILKSFLNQQSLDKFKIEDLNLKECIKKDFLAKPYLHGSDAEVTPKSFVFIPSKLVSIENDMIKISNTIKKEIIFSKIIEWDIQEIFKDLDVKSIYQVYFIPSSGLVRILNKNKHNPVKYYKDMFQRKTIFSDRPFFNQIILKDDKFRKSDPYIDVAGDGIIITYVIFIRNKNLDITGMIGLDRKVEPIKNFLERINLGPGVLKKDFEIGTHIISQKQCSDCHSGKFGDNFNYNHIGRNFENEAVALAIEETLKKRNEELESITRFSFENIGSTVFLLRIGPEELAYFLFNPENTMQKYYFLQGLYILAILCLTTIIIVTVRIVSSTSKAERTHTEIVSHLNVGLIILDEKGKIKFHNKKIENLVEESNLRNKNFPNNYMTDETRIEYNDLNQRLKSSFEFTGRIKRTDGTVFPAIITSTSIEYPGIKNSQMLIVIPSEQLERTIAAKFIHSFSHTLKTPVSGILLLTDRLRRKKALPKFGYYFSLIRQQVDEFSNTVTKLLGFSKLEFEDIRPHKGITNLAAILRNSLKPYKEKTSKTKIELKVDIPERLMAEVDVDMFKVILNNLLENALKYTIRGDIAVEAKENPKEVLISVADTGIGVPEDERNKIFDKFFRGRAKEVQSSDGTGIGLYLSKRYSELQGWKLSCEPKIEKVKIKKGQIVIKRIGSRFIIQIPKKKEGIELNEKQQNFTS